MHNQLLKKSSVINIELCLWLLKTVITTAEHTLIIFIGIRFWKISGIVRDWTNILRSWFLQSVANDLSVTASETDLSHQIHEFIKVLQLVWMNRSVLGYFLKEAAWYFFLLCYILGILQTNFWIFPLSYYTLDFVAMAIEYLRYVRSNPGIDKIQAQAISHLK